MSVCVCVCVCVCVLITVQGCILASRPLWHQSARARPQDKTDNGDGATWLGLINAGRRYKIQLQSAVNGQHYGVPGTQFWEWSGSGLVIFGALAHQDRAAPPVLVDMQLHYWVVGPSR
jgi:hypothetical protein